MATRIPMKHKETGVVRDGYYGFSWTTLFFGFFPALFRSDFVTFIGGFIVQIIVGAVTWGIGAFLMPVVWAFMYNKYYTRRLIENGYEFFGTPDENRAASEAVGVVDAFSGQATTVQEQQFPAEG